jgi:hypothetical protein
MIMALVNTRNARRSRMRATAAFALLTGMTLVVAGCVPNAHAAPRRIRTACLACALPQPTVSIDNLVAPYPGDTYPSVDPNADSVRVSGAKFTPGDLVHVALISSLDGSLMAEAETTATLPLTVPLGNGQYATFPGGKIAVNLSPSPNSPVLCTSVPAATVVAVDEGGLGRARSATVDPGFWWADHARAYDPNQCLVGPTPTPDPGTGGN